MDVKQLVAQAGEHYAGRRLAEAEQLYRQALAHEPNDANALNGLALIALRVGRLADAERMLRSALARQPGFLPFYPTLASVLRAQNHLHECEQVLRAAVARAPDRPESYNDLGDFLRTLGRLPEAVALCRKSLELDPEFGPAHNNLGAALVEYPTEAAEHLRRALALLPQHEVTIQNNLAAALLAQGRVGEAIAARRRALEIAPDSLDVRGGLLYLLNYSPSVSAAELAEEHARYGALVERGLSPAASFPNDRQPSRRLRVGYVSGDFRRHPMEYFIEGIFAAHHRSDVEVFAYSQTAAPDATAARLRAKCDQWRDIHGLSDDQAAALVRRDTIDILVDLSQHSAGQRLGVFARRAAPVQMTYLGYPGATGVRSIRYRVIGAGMESASQREGAEEMLQLPSTYFCYQPSPDAGAVMLRRDSDQALTFGSFNRLAKLNDRVIDTWGRILSAVEGSRLLLMSAGLGEAATRKQLIDRFVALGIAPQRLDLQPPRDLAGYFAAHHEIDIALDPFPFNGGTTTVHALWMGVPVVTLAGELPVGRMGVNILASAGMSEWVAGSIDEYVAIASRLAADRSRLVELRRTARQRLERSPIMQADAFARDLEKLYRDAWQRWCESP
jgi:predicted O-linked N-acetylglucosamine transferase (SPINDLY family)